MNAQTLDTLYIYIYIDNFKEIKRGRNTFNCYAKRQIIFEKI